MAARSPKEKCFLLFRAMSTARAQNPAGSPSLFRGAIRGMSIRRNDEEEPKRTRASRGKGTITNKTPGVVWLKESPRMMLAGSDTRLHTVEKIKADIRLIMERRKRHCKNLVPLEPNRYCHPHRPPEEKVFPWHPGMRSLSLPGIFSSKVHTLPMQRPVERAHPPGERRNSAAKLATSVGTATEPAAVFAQAPTLPQCEIADVTENDLPPIVMQPVEPMRIQVTFRRRRHSKGP